MRLRLTAGVVAAVAFLMTATPARADNGRSAEVRTVELRDRCDPATFNAVLGNGACVPHKDARVTLDELLEKLNPVDFGHDGWRNNPDKTEIRKGDSLKVTVRGGEAHSFTEVASFGPGCVDDLNLPLGLGPGPGPEVCGPLFATLIPAGANVTIANLSPGTHRFMCIIHPWMKTTVDVRNS
ncbi:MAG: hypothetical protein QOJ19_2117 [Acidimicrobiia bacterium]|jgi:plastocyanin|nr:hypothetical protein [Acidimicrobiia bacterium]